jgi:hypothetical protein
VGRARGQRLAVERRPPRRRGGRRPYRWPDEAIEAELRAFVHGRDEFPTLTEFDDAGRADLRAAVTDHGGVPFWAKRVGLPVPEARERRSYSDDDAVRDAAAVIAKYGRLPGEPTLRRLGYARLATAVRRAGGAAAFCRRHGITG